MVKFIAMACQFGWVIPVASTILGDIPIAHTVVRLAYLYLERLSEEQHRNTRSEAHDRIDVRKLASVGFALEAMALKVHVDAERLYYADILMYAKSTSG